MTKTKAAPGAASMPAEGTVEGYAATFDRIPDAYGDVIKQGAFADTLKAWEESGKPIPLLYGHNTDIGGFIALALACRRLREEGWIARNPIVHYVTGVSAGIVEDTALLDLQYSEDSAAQVDLNCVMNERGEIIELQGTGEGRAFTLTEQQELVALCAKGNKELLKIQREILGGN